MKCNVAPWDKYLRLIVGFLFVAWAAAGGPWWAYFGLVLIATGAWRFCPIYAVLRQGTAKNE